MQFDDTLSRGEAILEEALSQGVQEGLQLDFKQATTGDGVGAVFTADGKLGKDGRRILGKAISAFSNSAGGLIIIGADCRRGPDGLDSLGDLKPFTNWRVAQSAISGALGELLQPKHDSIRVHGFPSERNPALGYIAIDVPRSDRRPHMCQANKQYYKRSGASSFAMEHYDIEDAMKRHATPLLEVVPEIQLARNVGTTSGYEVRLWLVNEGSVSAQSPALDVSITANFAFGWGTHEPQVHREVSAGGSRAVSYAVADFIVHPGQRRIIDRFEFSAQRGPSGIIETVGSAHIMQAMLQLTFWVHALNMPTRKGSHTFNLLGQLLGR